MVQRLSWLLLAVGISACSGGEPPPAAPVTTAAESFDLVIAGGRVIDPESGLDAVRHLGIREGSVAAISAAPLAGRHDHRPPPAWSWRRVSSTCMRDLAGTPVSSRFQAMDGVTTALELEIGAFPVDRWYSRRGGDSLINYGASVSHQGARLRALGRATARANAEGTFSLGESGDGALYRAADDEELARLGELMASGLREGAIGFGFGLGYTPGASHRELLADVRDRGGGHEAPVFIHLRSVGGVRARRRAGAVPGSDCPTPRPPARRCTSSTSTARPTRSPRRRWP